MFTSSLPQHNQSKLIKNHHGVSLEMYQCHELQNDAFYSKYQKNQLHYVIDAAQKGHKLPTQIGLRRIIRKNTKKNIAKKLNQKAIPELNPKGPEEICMKALRTEFRQNLEKNHMQAELELQERSQKIIKRKEHQRQRRNELIRLVKKYREHLQSHFGNRLIGYGRCPKISRQQIKDYLKTLGIEAKLDPAEVKISAEKEVDRRNQRRGGRGRRGFPQRLPLPRMGMGMVPFGMSPPPFSMQPPFGHGMMPPIGTPIGIVSSIPPLLGNMPPIGQIPKMGEPFFPPGLFPPIQPEEKLKNTIKDKDKYFKMEPNTAKSLVKSSLAFLIEKAGLTKDESIKLTNDIALKEDLMSIFSLLQNPEEIKKRPEFLSFSFQSQNSIIQVPHENPPQINEPVAQQNKQSQMKAEEINRFRVE